MKDKILILKRFFGNTINDLAIKKILQKEYPEMVDKTNEDTVFFCYFLKK